ncbi:hypothetical protein DL770_001656 [Monosporascus sp. CRB-9-2]|nr:hypothetical protein DL770_001656 [Monosporascus sp. CRB-9-2]
MKVLAGLVLLASAAQAAPHYTFPNLAGEAAWSSVRQTANFQSNGPVTDVNSQAIRCYERSPGTAAPSTTAVRAGGQITFVAAPSIYHPGALSAYMAKAPGKAADFDGSGPVWFKVYQDMPTLANGQYQWPSDGKSQLTFTIPQCIENGEYLFRIEHVALHSASSVIVPTISSDRGTSCPLEPSMGTNGAQFYISCAQVSVSGGSGSKKPSNLVSFPGAYSPNDPGLLINIYNNGGKQYQPAGPSVFTC